MKTKRIVYAFSLVLVFLFFSCIDEDFQRIESLDSVSTDSSITVNWTLTQTGKPTELKLSLSSETNRYQPAIDVTGKTSYEFTNLEINKRYTITLYNYNGKDLLQKKEIEDTVSDKTPFVYEYSDDEPFFEVPSGFVKVILKNVKAGKTIVYANCNSSESFSLNKEYIRRLKTTHNASRTAVESGNFPDENKTFKEPDEDYIIPYNDKLNLEEIKTNSVRSGVRSNFQNKFNKDNPSIDNDYCYFWIDTTLNKDYSGYRQKPCTLRAIGKVDGKIVCYVWVDNDFYSDKSKDNKINKQSAEYLAENFCKICMHERDVFGQESEWLIGESNKISLEENSVTGSVVNIIVTDIESDFTNKTKLSHVIGYFSSFDYYATTQKTLSNQGKYLYIDAPFCNKNGNTYNGITDKSGKSIVSPDIVSTLAHEFQHLINFGNKCIGIGNNSSKWFNEMLSMLAEDILHDAIGIKLENSVKQVRLPWFNANYYKAGLENWSDEKEVVLYSYSMSYAFGAWLVRNYGGIPLIHEMSTNKFNNMTSILEAIKTVTGNEVNCEQLLKEFVQACVFRDEFAKKQNLPTFNHDAGENNSIYESFGIKSIISPVNIFSKSYGYEISESKGIKNYGPYLREEKEDTLYKTGFIIHKIKDTEQTETLELDFTVPKDFNRQYEHLYFFIQDKFDETQPENDKKN